MIIEVQKESGLATDGRCTCIPWTDILKNARAFIDPEYLPDYDTLDSDPSHLSMPKVKKLLRYWFDRQKSGQITFRFHYVLEGSETVLAKEPKKILSMEVLKGRGDPKQNRVTRRKGNCLKKDKARSRDIISDSGEEFDFDGVEEVPSSDDDANPLPSVGRSKSTPAAGVHQTPGTTVVHTPDWRKAPANLSTSEIDDWNRFTKNLPESCSNWTREQAIVQFQVFKGWSANVPSPKKDMHSTKRDIPDNEVASESQVHSVDIPGESRGIRNAGLGDVDLHHSIRKAEDISPFDNSGNPELRPHDDSKAKDLGIMTSIPKSGTGISLDKCEDVGALAPPSHLFKSPGSTDVPHEDTTSGNTTDQQTTNDKELGIVGTDLYGMNVETPNAFGIADDPGLAESPRGPKTPGNRMGQPRTKTGKFVKFTDQSKEQSNGKKRVREDHAGTFRDPVTTELPSHKKAKVGETSTEPKRTGRSTRNADKCTEPGFSAPITRSKSKSQKTRR